MRKSYMSRILLPAVALLLAATSCSEKKWHIEGSVDGAGGKQIIVEAPNAHGGWYPIDTVEVASDGTFKVAGEAFGHPELVRLSLDGATAYLPVDSIETVTFAAKGNAFAATARISGTPSADKMQEVNDLITKVAKAQGSAAAPFDQDLKRSLAEVILRDPANIVAYYLIFHKVGDTPLYSPEDRSDLRIIGAVANAYTQLRPADPRTPLLTDLFLTNRKMLHPREMADTLMAQEMKFPEISLYDEKGHLQSLTAEAHKGKVVVLCFTAYSLPNSQAMNVELNKVYTAHKAQGLEIFQVGVDEDEYQWKESAKNMPWITVFNAPAQSHQNMTAYNVTELPALFIINRNGDLVERVESISRLESAVARYL